jgi:toxin ParE1/3/4
VYRITVSPRARRDLVEIVDYISKDNPNAAEQFGRAILNHIELLATFPRVGAPLKGRPEIRKLLHSPVRIYYRVDEKRKRVQILHFWHSARKEPKL